MPLLVLPEASSATGAAMLALRGVGDGGGPAGGPPETFAASTPKAASTTRPITQRTALPSASSFTSRGNAVTPPADRPFIRMADIHKQFAAVHVLDGIDLEIGHGETIGLVGDNRPASPR